MHGKNRYLRAVKDALTRASEESPRYALSTVSTDHDRGRVDLAAVFQNCFHYRSLHDMVQRRMAEAATTPAGGGQRELTPRTSGGRTTTFRVRFSERIRWIYFPGNLQRSRLSSPPSKTRDFAGHFPCLSVRVVPKLSTCYDARTTIRVRTTCGRIHEVDERRIVRRPDVVSIERRAGELVRGYGDRHGDVRRELTTLRKHAAKITGSHTELRVREAQASHLRNEGFVTPPAWTAATATDR